MDASLSQFSEPNSDIYSFLVLRHSCSPNTIHGCARHLVLHMEQQFAHRPGWALQGSASVGAYRVRTTSKWPFE